MTASRWCEPTSRYAITDTHYRRTNNGCRAAAINGAAATVARRDERRRGARDLSPLRHCSPHGASLLAAARSDALPVVSRAMRCVALASGRLS